ncbi:MAG: PQQ-dependent sugar dehydrogenase, partial [Anaerolineales bacterium]
LTTAPVEEIEKPLYRAEVFAEGLSFPVAMEFAPDGSLYYAEKNGGVRVLSPQGELQPNPVYTVPVDGSGERGLLGIALAPDFADSGHIWVYYTAADALVNRVGRFTVRDGVGADFQDAFEDRIAFETSTILNGGGLHFGLDGMLYISFGSTNNVLTANEADTPHGKLLRAQPTIPLTPALDNPDPASLIYARGFRNMFDFTIHPVTGQVFGTENGGDCDDEVNLIVAGGHYGWRENGLCEDNNLPADYPYQRPLIYYTPPAGLTGIDFYQGDEFPEWQGDMLYCGWHSTDLVRVKWNEDFTRIITADILETGAARCRIDVLTGPDGAIYFQDITTIYRLVRN